MSTQNTSQFDNLPRDPLRLVYAAYEASHKAPVPSAAPSNPDPDRAELIFQLLREGHSHSAWSNLFHQAVAERLGLNTTDQKCLELIKAGPTTPGELAKLTNLTTGAVTSVLDRLERCGFVKREHDSEDRRRIIVQVDIEKLKREVAPLFGCLEKGYNQLCAEYTDDQLRFLISYFQKNQAMLKEATETLREQEAIAIETPAS